jgi:plasmid stabilization system protein ParE
MKVVIRREAERDLADILKWIEKDNPPAARKLVARIRDRIGLLELNALARMGRAGVVPGTLELIEYPYIVVYRFVRTSRKLKSSRSCMAHETAT